MFAALAVLVLIPMVFAIPIDNGVEGEPEVECGATGITINFNTRNAFAGHVYVKGRFAEPGCRSDEGGRQVAGINLPFASCGTERTRSLNPRGVFVRQTVVISFHPQFLTKVDRAYTIQCFYMEADKTVSQELEVAEITTGFQSQIVPMPVCRYDILEGGPTGQPVKFALIGQQVFHKWTCDTETTDIFCMTVHSCTVDDGTGNKANLLDENGCGLDKHLLQNLEYTTDLMAGRESHVFKYADKAALFFSCQISITIKEPGAECARPQCGEPGEPSIGAAKGTGAPARGTPAPAKGSTARPAPPATRPPATKALTAAPALAVISNAPIESIKTAPPTVAVSTAFPSFTAPAIELSSTAAQSVASTGVTPAGTSAAPLAASTAGIETQSTAAASVAPTTGPVPPAASSSAPTTNPTTGPPSSPGSQPPTPTAGAHSDATPLPSVVPSSAGTLAPILLARKKRQARNRQDEVGVWDVSAQPITAFEIDDESTYQQSLRATPGIFSGTDAPTLSMDYCLSPMLLSLVVATTVVSMLIAGIVTFLFCSRRTKSTTF